MQAAIPNIHISTESIQRGCFMRNDDVLRLDVLIAAKRILKFTAGFQRA